MLQVQSASFLFGHSRLALGGLSGLALERTHEIMQRCPVWHFQNICAYLQ